MKNWNGISTYKERDMSLGTILLALLVFSLVVIFHEFGHFIVAKYNKVRVIEFSLGMGPRLVSLAKSEAGRKVLFLKSSRYFEEHPEYDDYTVYSWKVLPFGGSCMMLGEEEAMDSENSFSKKSVYARMAIIFAGPFFNFILAFLLALILIGTVGYSSASITMIEQNSPLTAAGVQQGDMIKEINGEKIVVSGEVGFYLALHPMDGSPVEMTLERNGERFTKTVTPVSVQNNDGSQSYKLLFGYGARQKVGAWKTIGYAAYEVKYWISTVVKSLGQMITGHVSRKDVSGPVGIVKIVGSSVNTSMKAGEKTGTSVQNAIFTLINLCIMLTANLGVMNLIPIPALDGGRLVFLIAEWIRRKPLPQKFESYTNTVGFMMLMALMVFILVNDVVNLF